MAVFASITEMKYGPFFFDFLLDYSKIQLNN